MPNNLWPWISKFAIPAESQIAEGGGPYPADAAWNCVFAVVSVILQVLGYPDIAPEALRQLVQPGTHAGSSFDKVAAYLRAHPERWPNLPRIDTWNPADTLGTFDQMLAKGYLTAFDAWDDGNGVLLNHAPPQGYSHAMLLEAQGLTKTTAWNPWDGAQAGQTFDKSFMKAATWGGTGNLMVFARNIVPAPIVIVTPPVKPPVVTPPVTPVTPVTPARLPQILSDGDVVKLLMKTGFVGDPLLDATAVVFAESGIAGGADAHASNAQGNTPPSTDRGLFQINDHWHAEVTDDLAYDPVTNAAAAFRISKSGTDWHEWSSWPAAAAGKMDRAKAAITAVLPAPVVQPPVVEPPVISPPPTPPADFWGWLKELAVWLRRLFGG